MLSSNMWTEQGLVNGSVGTIVAILYRSDGPPDLPIAVVVHSDKYNSPTWEGRNAFPLHHPSVDRGEQEIGRCHANSFHLNWHGQSQYANRKVLLWIEL